MNIKSYKPGKKIIVNDLMQKNYSYILTKNYGDLSDYPEFKPELSPSEMLNMGIFEGKYLNDCVSEFPKEWFSKAFKLGKLSKDKSDPMINFFKIKSRQPLSVWKQKGWIYGNDVRGWFQWYCRFYIGRRDPNVDPLQIKRWKSFKRHKGQILKNCKPKDLSCRPKQRQALLQWAYNPIF
jgi:hypothetical protein